MRVKKISIFRKVNSFQGSFIEYLCDFCFRYLYFRHFVLSTFYTFDIFIFDILFSRLLLFDISRFEISFSANFLSVLFFSTFLQQFVRACPCFLKNSRTKGDRDLRFSPSHPGNSRNGSMLEPDWSTNRTIELKRAFMLSNVILIKFSTKIFSKRSQHFTQRLSLTPY